MSAQALVRIVAIISLFSCSVAGCVDATPADQVRFRRNGETTVHRQPDILTDIRVPTDGPPLSRFYRVLRQLRHIHASSAAEGNTRFARQVAEQVQRLESRFRFVSQAAVHTEPVLHMVGLYEPSTEATPAVVRVTDCSGPIVLVVTAYDATTWQVCLDDEVQVDFVICSGYHRQRVTGLPDGVPVFAYSHDDGAPQYAYSYSGQGADFQPVRNTIRSWTGGLDVATFQGSYSYNGRPFVVGPENPEWRVQMLVHELLPPENDNCVVAQSTGNRDAEPVE